MLLYSEFRCLIFILICFLKAGSLIMIRLLTYVVNYKGRRFQLIQLTPQVHLNGYLICCLLFIFNFCSTSFYVKNKNETNSVQITISNQVKTTLKLTKKAKHVKCSCVLLKIKHLLFS